MAAAVMALAGLLAGYLGLQAQPAGFSPGTPDFVNADRPGINAHNSPSVAAHPPPGAGDGPGPAVIAVVDRIDTPRFSCSVALSTTAGVAWRQLALPLPADAPNCHQPDVAFDADGRLLVLYTATGGRFNQPVGVWLQRFDGEAPAGPAVQVAPAEAFHARMAVEGDRVWVTWIQVDGAAEKPLGFGTTPAPVRLASSVDGGATWAEPVTVSEGRRVVQPTPVPLGGDGLLVGALDLAEGFDDYEARHEGQGGPPDDARRRVVAWLSSDAGAGFGPTITVAGDLVAPDRIIVNLAPAPSFARDPGRDGRLYAAWDAGAGDGRDVFLARSDDGGATWSDAVAVAPRPRGQFLPAVGVSPAGRVDVVFYDRSADPEDHRAQVALASSFDGGRTFATTTISREAFDTRIGFASLQGILVMGSRLAVLSEADRALALWSDTSRGSVDDGVQDLAAVSVELEEGGGRRPLLVVLGALLLGLGGGLALVVGLRPGDGGPQQP